MRFGSYFFPVFAFVQNSWFGSCFLVCAFVQKDCALDLLVCYFTRLDPRYTKLLGFIPGGSHRVCNWQDCEDAICESDEERAADILVRLEQEVEMEASIFDMSTPKGTLSYSDGIPCAQ